MIQSDHRSDVEYRIDALGRPYTRRGPKPQPRSVVARHFVKVRLTENERVGLVMLASEEECTLSEVMREALLRYIGGRRSGS